MSHTVHDHACTHTPSVAVVWQHYRSLTERRAHDLDPHQLEARVAAADGPSHFVFPDGSFAPVARKQAAAGLDGLGPVWVTNQTLLSACEQGQTGAAHDTCVAERTALMKRLFESPVRLLHYERRSTAECEFKQARAPRPAASNLRAFRGCGGAEVQSRCLYANGCKLRDVRL